MVIYATGCLLFLAAIELELENEGRYDPVLYRDWRTRETGKYAMDEPSGSNSDGGLIARLPMPRYLCYVEDIEPSTVAKNGRGVTREVEPGSNEEYIFIAYTREQFDTRDSHEDRVKLLEIGILCANKANVKAFWVDCYPVDEDYSEKEDIYRICDIVRSAHSLAIATNSTCYLDEVFEGVTRSNARKKALEVWGERAWTLPEVLLCSSQYKISVVDHSSSHRAEYNKHGLGYRAWTDWAEASKLVDHYEGSVPLSPLELISIAHRCLRNRRIRGVHHVGKQDDATREYAYALMGLLRRRPKIVGTDSGFMAFARLSLSNNNDSIVERLLCMQPPKKGTQWYEMADAWGAQLWDIEPSCQIAAIDGFSEPPFDQDAPTQCVVLDGVFGASICWSELAPAPYIKRSTLIRRLTTTVLPNTPHLFLFALLYLFSSAYYRVWEGFEVPNDASLAIWTIVTAIGLVMLLATPYLLKNLFHGKFWSTQARFYGIEGYHDIEQLEKQLFGINEGRLRWSTNASLQSDATLAKDGLNFEGKDPHAKEKLPGRDADGRCLFTIVDTYVLKVTAFYAARPPTVAMVLGQERGMQRVALCSYDWRTQALCREVVLRMKTVVLNRMSRVDKFRFTLQRPERKS